MSQGFDWTLQDIDEFCFGYQSPWTDIQLADKQDGRVTITEIAEDDWDMLDDESAGDKSCSSDEDEPDFILGSNQQIERIFEDIVDDWKIKMECIVGDGLKRLRKSCKEKRTMVRYLPGDRRVGAAKMSIVRDWKIDLRKTFGNTHKKLEKLAQDKAREVDNVGNQGNRSERENAINKNKKRLVNLDYRKRTSNKARTNFAGLKDLIRELNRMAPPSPVPIYSQPAETQILPAYNNFPLANWLNMRRCFNTSGSYDYLRHRQSILDAIDDFKANHCDKLVSKTSEAKRSLVTGPAKTVKSTCDNWQDHYLEQVEKDGRKRFFIVKKASQVDAEDIFTDWKFNLESFEQRKAKAIASRKRRPRKLSNRAIRKVLLKEVVPHGPQLYAEVVKKNIKGPRESPAPAEDIFEAWRDYLQELDDLLGCDSATSFSSDRSSEEILKTSRRDWLACELPAKPASREKYAAETTFAAWRHNLACDEVRRPAKYCAPESHFSAWRHNFGVESLRDRRVAHEDSALIFAEWRHNLQPEEYANQPIQKAKKVKKCQPKVEVGPVNVEDFKREEPPAEGAHLLKNKQRQQRRSKKKSGHRDF